MCKVYALYMTWRWCLHYSTSGYLVTLCCFMMHCVSRHHCVTLYSFTLLVYFVNLLLWFFTLLYVTLRYAIPTSGYFVTLRYLTWIILFIYLCSITLICSSITLTLHCLHQITRLLFYLTLRCFTLRYFSLRYFYFVTFL